MKRILLASLLVFPSFVANAVDLESALVNTYNTNPELMAEREKLKETDESMFDAIAEFLPVIGYEKRVTTSRSDTLRSISTGKKETISPWSNSTTNSDSIILKQNLFKSGASIAAMEIARARINAGRQILTSKEQEVLLNGINAYLSVIEKKRIMQISENTVRAFNKIYQAAKERFDAGITTKSDVAQAESLLAQRVAERANARAEYYISLQTFRKIVGMEPVNLIIPAIHKGLPKSLDEYVALVSKSNPDLMSTIYNTNAAEYAAKASMAGLLPSLDLQAQMSRDQESSKRFGKQPLSNSKSVIFSLSIPIYDASIYSTIRRQNDREARAKEGLKSAYRETKEKAYRVWHSYKAIMSGYSSALRSVEAAKVALDGMDQEYQEGLRTMTELLNSQSLLNKQQVNFEQRKKDKHIVTYQILQLMGKLSAKDLALPTTIYDPKDHYHKTKFKLIGF